MPENSLLAFQNAVASGAEVIELDVWLLACGTVVVFHDKTLSRMTGQQGELTSLRYEELPALSDALPNQSERLKDLVDASSREQALRIPTLEEVLLATPQEVSIVIELKQNSDALVAAVVALLRTHQRMQQVFWFCLDEAVNTKLRHWEGATSLPLITSVQGMLRVFLLYYLGVLPLCSVDCDVFGITTEDISLDKIRRESSLRGLPDLAKQWLAAVFGGKPSRAMLCPALFRHLRRRGVAVWFLGVNHEHELELALRCGATGALTDRISWMSTRMRQRNLHFKRLH